MTYTLALGPYACGEHDFLNVASFVTGDIGAADSADWTVHVTVPCPQGCSLTPGYWNTHSELGPAPYDDTWALLSDGASTVFFLAVESAFAEATSVAWREPRCAVRSSRSQPRSTITTTGWSGPVIATSDQQQTSAIYRHRGSFTATSPGTVNRRAIAGGN